ncbi:hypothetical protein RF55_25884, partial [Lasius niger]
VLTSFEEFQGKGSGWVIEAIQYMEVMTAAYKPLAASSYIPLPELLFNKKAIINIQNKDHKCLIWSVLAALHPVEKNAERVTKYQAYENELNTDGLSFPTPLQQIGKFERMNNLSINVYGWENDEILPLRITANPLGIYFLYILTNYIV